MKYANDDRDYRGGNKPNGRGPVDLMHWGNVSQSWSRALNPIEQDPRVRRIQEWLDEDIELAKARAAQRFLILMREQIAGFNLKNHVVRISSASGASGVKVYRQDLNLGLVYDGSRWRNPKGPNGRFVPVRACYVEDLRGGRRSELVAILQEIDQFISGTDWAYHLDGEVLNPT